MAPTQMHARVFFMCAVSVLGTAHGTSWKRCDPGSALMDVTAVSVDPDPLRPGVQALFKLNVVQHAVVEAGKLTASVRYFGIQVYSKVGDLCEVGACPLPAGTHELKIKRAYARLPPAREDGAALARGKG